MLIEIFPEGVPFMRVVAGTAGGRKLETPGGNDVRPTTDMVKEAVFSIIQFELEGRSFLDLFAGSGQMGIEALSRGAKKVVFVDASKTSVGIVRKNLELTGLEKNAEIRNTDSISYLKGCGESFDLAFLDPPYRKGLIEKALELLPELMNRTGKIICEHPKDEKLPESIGKFSIKKQYRYGKIMLTVYAHEDFK